MTARDTANEIGRKTNVAVAKLATSLGLDPQDCRVTYAQDSTRFRVTFEMHAPAAEGSEVSEEKAVKLASHMIEVDPAVEDAHHPALTSAIEKGVLHIASLRSSWLLKPLDLSTRAAKFPIKARQMSKAGMPCEPSGVKCSIKGLALMVPADIAVTEFARTAVVGDQVWAYFLDDSADDANDAENSEYTGYYAATVKAATKTSITVTWDADGTSTKLPLDQVLTRIN